MKVKFIMIVIIKQLRQSRAFDVFCVSFTIAWYPQLTFIFSFNLMTLELHCTQHSRESSLVFDLCSHCCSHCSGKCLFTRVLTLVVDLEACIDNPLIAVCVLKIKLLGVFTCKFGELGSFSNHDWIVTKKIISLEANNLFVILKTSMQRRLKGNLRENTPMTLSLSQLIINDHLQNWRCIYHLRNLPFTTTQEMLDLQVSSNPADKLAGKSLHNLTLICLHFRVRQDKSIVLHSWERPLILKNDWGQETRKAIISFWFMNHEGITKYLSIIKSECEIPDILSNDCLSTESWLESWIIRSWHDVLDERVTHVYFATTQDMHRGIDQ